MAITGAENEHNKRETMTPPNTTITEKSLSAVKVGQRVVVSAIKSCPTELLQKLVSMGLVAGTEVEVTQRGFFGSPINVHLLGSVLSLRSVEAAHIQVVPL